jgi:putative endonuclease
MARLYCVYILANHSRHLYTGVTSDPTRRMWKHKTKFYGGYTANFHVDRLVYYETTTNARAAITREKQIKRWPRRRKFRLIERHNPDWRDLSDAWFDGDATNAAAKPRAPLDPSPR